VSAYRVAVLAVCTGIRDARAIARLVCVAARVVVRVVLVRVVYLDRSTATAINGATCDRSPLEASTRRTTITSSIRQPSSRLSSDETASLHQAAEPSHLCASSHSARPCFLSLSLFVEAPGFLTSSVSWMRLLSSANQSICASALPSSPSTSRRTR
jgi:hypothetical protein